MENAGGNRDIRGEVDPRGSQAHSIQIHGKRQANPVATRRKREAGGGGEGGGDDDDDVVPLTRTMGLYSTYIQCSSTTKEQDEKD